MKCPSCGGEVQPEEAFCGHCGMRLTPSEPTPTPVAPTKSGGLPIVPIIIGIVVLLVVCCLCLVVGGALGLCALPDIVPGETPTPQVILPQPTEATVPGFTITPKTPAPEASPTQSAPPPPSGDTPLQIVSYVQNTNALGGKSVEIMGEVENTSNQEINTGWYLVYVTLKDGNGNAISTGKDLTVPIQRPIMQPGQKSCFRYFFSAESYEFDISQVDRLEPVVRNAPNGHDAYTVELKVSNVKRTGNIITGDVTNDTSYSTRTVFTLITLYDSEGQVVGVHYGTRVGEQQMAPGGTMGFTFSITPSEAPRTDSFDVLVVAYKQ